MSPPSNTIPILDLKDWSPAHDERLVMSLAEFGLAHIAGHGLNPTHLDEFYREFLLVLNRPPAEKSTWGGSNIWFQRGWTPPDTERAVVAAGQPDFKECFFAAPLTVDEQCRHEHPEIYADNVWPDDAPDFRTAYLHLGQRLHNIGLKLLEATARGLGLMENVFADLVHGGPHVTRALKYLALTETQIENRVLWGEEHTDFNLLTLLPGGRFFDLQGDRIPSPDPDSGLYLRARSGERIRGGAPTGCIVIQVGQQLEILTGGRLLATPHVVTAPRIPNVTRCSAAHFVHMHAHQTVRPLPPFASEDALRSYAPPVLAGTYGLKTLVDIGLAPRAALESLGYRHYERLVQQRQQDG
ncbi:MAG: 2-oxoglutarate and iron-dependent oxygenase domain-containing protein [Myxococcota bacterium]|nr:2-oxoglutarate and iron-dependent oxygenase domain-containing protein [Myxococcota bacterium]